MYPRKSKQLQLLPSGSNYFDLNTSKSIFFQIQAVYPDIYSTPQTLKQLNLCMALILMIPSCFQIYLLYSSKLKDGLQTGIGAPCPDKSKLNPPPSPDDSNGGSDSDDGGLTTASKFVSVNFLFLFLHTKNF